MLNATAVAAKPVWERIGDYCHHTLRDRPKLAAITEVALLALSLIAYHRSGCTPLFGLVMGSGVLLGASLVYEWSHLFRQVWHGLLNRPYEPAFKPTFKEEEFLGENKEVLATVEYSGHLPILTFNAAVTDPAQRGYIHGYLLADQIVDMCQKALRPMLAFLQWEKGESGPARLKETIDRLVIPDDVRSELSAIVKGVEERCKRNGTECPKDLTALIFGAHVMTDHYKAIGSSLGCSTLVYRAQVGEAPVVGRNLDWVSMGYLGRHLFVRRYEVATEKGSRTINSFSFPGYVGVLTAWNSDGLVVIVNELGKTAKGEGKPYSLMTKELVEGCANVGEAVKWLGQHQETFPCASSVSIVLVDSKQAKLYHYYPEGSDHILIRDLSDEGVLAVTNHAHDWQGNILPESICERKSVDRWDRLHAAVQVAKKERKQSVEIVESALKAAGVTATVGVFIANLASGEKKLLLDDFSAHQQIDKRPYLKI